MGVLFLNSIFTRFKCNSGFGIVELIVAITVVSIMLVSFAPFLMNSLNNSVNNASRVEANQLATNQISLARSLIENKPCFADSVYEMGYEGSVEVAESSLTCPDENGVLATYNIKIKQSSTGNILVDKTAKIFVKNE